jgi:hypothetical protein
MPLFFFPNFVDPNIGVDPSFHLPFECDKAAFAVNIKSVKLCTYFFEAIDKTDKNVEAFFEYKLILEVL